MKTKHSKILSFVVALGLEGCVSFNNSSKNRRDLETVVPEAYEFSKTAYQLTGDEVEKYTGLFSYFGKYRGEISRTNPFTIPREELKKVPPSNPSFANFDMNNIMMERMGFYNSAGHSLEKRTGSFIVEGVLLKDGKSTKKYLGIMHSGSKFKNACSVSLRRGNLVVGVGMDMDVEPTKEFEDFVGYLVTEKKFVGALSKKCSQYNNFLKMSD